MNDGLSLSHPELLTFSPMFVDEDVHSSTASPDASARSCFEPAATGKAASPASRPGSAAVAFSASTEDVVAKSTRYSRRPRPPQQSQVSQQRPGQAVSARRPSFSYSHPTPATGAASGSVNRNASLSSSSRVYHQQQQQSGPALAGTMRYRILAERLAEAETLLKRCHCYVDDEDAENGESENVVARHKSFRRPHRTHTDIMSAQCYDDILAESGSDVDEIHLEQYNKRDLYKNMERRELRIRQLHQSAMWATIVQHCFFLRLLTAKNRRFSALMRLKRWFRGVILIRRARRTAGMRVYSFHTGDRPTREYILQTFPFLNLFDLLQGEPQQDAPDEGEVDNTNTTTNNNNNNNHNDGNNSNAENATAAKSPIKMSSSTSANGNSSANNANSSSSSHNINNHNYKTGSNNSHDDEQRRNSETASSSRTSGTDFLLPSFERQKLLEEEKARQVAEDARQRELQAAFGVQPPPPIPRDVAIRLKPAFTPRLPRGTHTYSDAIADGLARRTVHVTGNHLANIAQRYEPVSAWYVLREGRVAEFDDPHVHVEDDAAVIDSTARKIHIRNAAPFGWLLPLPLPSPQGQLLLLGTRTLLWRLTRANLFDAVYELFDCDRDPVTAAAVQAVFARATQEATAAAMRADFAVTPEMLRRSVPTLCSVSDFALRVFCSEAAQSPKTQQGPLWLRRGAQLAHAGSLHNDVLLPCGFGTITLRRQVAAGANGSNAGRTITLRGAPGMRAVVTVPEWDERHVQLTADHRLLINADELILPRPTECDVFVSSEWLAAWRFDKTLFQRLILHDPTEFVTNQRPVVTERLLSLTLPDLASITTIVQAKIPILRHVSAPVFSKQLSPLFERRLLTHENGRITRYPNFVDGIYLIAHGQVRRRRYGTRLVLGSEEHQQILRDGGTLHDPTIPQTSYADDGACGSDSARGISNNNSGTGSSSNFIISYDVDVRDPSTWLALGGQWEGAMDFLPEPQQRKGTAPLASNERWAASWDSKWYVGAGGFVMLWFLPSCDIPVAFREMSLEHKKKSVELAVAARAHAVKIHPQVVARITIADQPVLRVASFSESNMDMSTLMSGASSNNLRALRRGSGHTASFRFSSSVSPRPGGTLVMKRERSGSVLQRGASPVKTNNALNDDADDEIAGAKKSFQILTTEQQQQLNITSVSGHGSGLLSGARFARLMNGTPSARRPGDDALAQPSYYSPSSAAFRAKAFVLPALSKQPESAKLLMRRLARMGIDGNVQNDYRPTKRPSLSSSSSSSSSSSARCSHLGQSDDDDDSGAGHDGAAEHSKKSPEQRSPYKPGDRLNNIFDSLPPLSKKERKKLKLLHPPVFTGPMPPRSFWESGSATSIGRTTSREAAERAKRQDDNLTVLQSEQALLTKHQQELKQTMGALRYDHELQTDPSTIYLGYRLPAPTGGAQCLKEHEDLSLFSKLRGGLDEVAIDNNNNNNTISSSSRGGVGVAEKKIIEVGKCRSRQDEVVMLSEKEPVATKLEALLRSTAEAQRHKQTSTVAAERVAQDVRHVVERVVVSVSDGHVAVLEGRTLPFTKPTALSLPARARQQQQQHQQNLAATARGPSSQKRVDELLRYSVSAASAAYRGAGAGAVEHHRLSSVSCATSASSETVAKSHSSASVAVDGGGALVVHQRSSVVHAPPAASAPSSSARARRADSTASAPVLFHTSSSLTLAGSITFRGQKVVLEDNARCSNNNSNNNNNHGKSAPSMFGVAATTTTDGGGAAATLGKSKSSIQLQLLSSIQAMQQQQALQLEQMSLFERENNPTMRYSRPVTTAMATARDFARFEKCLLTIKKKTKKKTKNTQHTTTSNTRPDANETVRRSVSSARK